MEPLQTTSQYPKNWTSDAIRRYFTRESRQKGKDEFYATHVPINRIKVEQDDVFNIAGDDYVTERDVRRVVTGASLDNDNRLFFLVGESGCGKSELCQWLDYEIGDGNYESAETNDFDHVPIHIPRQVREPKEVLQRLASHLDEDISGGKKLSELHPDAVYQQTIGTIKNQFVQEFESTHELFTDDEFEQEVHSNLREFVQSFDDPDMEIEFEPIPHSELEELVEKYPSTIQEHTGSRDKTVDFLYKEIKTGGKEAIQSMLELGDLKPTLSELSSRFQDRDERPVLIIEDLAGFTIYEHELLSFFSDLDTGNWDVVIGMTTGIHDGLTASRRPDRFAEDTINDRIQARLIMTEQTDDGARTLFLEQEDVHIDLAKQYLDAIKEEGEGSFQSPPPVDEAELNEAFEGLYPFNKAFLDRIYDNLQEDENKKQTPRVFLKFVLEDLLDNENPPFTQAEHLRKLGTINDYISTEYEEEDRPVLKWYGRQKGDKQFVDPIIPEVFGIESSGEAPLAESQEMKELEIQDDEEVDPDIEQWETYQDRMNDLLAWRRGETTFDQTQAIERGAQRLLLFFHDDINALTRKECLAQDAAYIAWEKGSDEVQVHVDNGDEPQYRMVVLHQDIPEKVLLDLLYLGIYDDDDETILAHASDSGVGRRPDPIDLPALQEWARDVSDSYQDSLEQDVIDEFDVSLDEMALFGKYLLNVFSGNSVEFSAEALAQPVENPDLNPSYKPLELEIDLNTLDNHAETLTRLFKSRFHLRQNTVDYERLETVVEQTSPEELVETVRNATKGITGFKIGPKKSESTQLRSFLTSPSDLNLRGCARDLKDYQSSYTEDLESDKAELVGIATLYNDIEAPDDIDLDSLRFAYNQTSVRPQHLDDVADLPADQFATVTQDLQEAADQLEGSTSLWEFLSAYRRFARLKYQHHSDQYKTLRDFAKELDRVNEELDGIIEQKKEEEFEPDTSMFESAKQTAQQVADNLGDTL